MTVPLWSVAPFVRTTIDPSRLVGDVVHYSIPALEGTGAPLVEDAIGIASSKLLLRGTEVLVSRLNPRKARVALVEADLRPLLASTEFVALEPTRCDRRFLYYFLQADHIRQSLEAQVQSTTRSHQRVGVEQIMRLPFSSIPRGDQQRIACFLDEQVRTLDAALAARAQQGELVSERIAAETEGVLTQLSRDHGVRRLGRSILSIEQGWSPECDAFPAGRHEWGVLKVSAIRPGLFRPDENKRLPLHLTPRVQYRVQPGDLLVTRANTPSLVGQFAVVPAEAPRNLLLCDKIMRIRLDSMMSEKFVSLVASDRRSRQYFAMASSGASQSMVNVRGGDVRALQIPGAPRHVQDQVAQQVASQHGRATSLIDALEVQRRLLQERKQALITAAVTGQFDVTTARKVSTT